jgi:peptide/nickel transport system substrate-binding protein
MYTELQQILKDEGGAVIPFFADYLNAATSKLKYGELSTNFPMDGMKLSERWWFA